MTPPPTSPGVGPPDVAVFASGGGTNLQALIDRVAGADDPGYRIALVVASRPGIGALERAERAGIRSVVLEDPSDGERLCVLLRDQGIGWIVLAGYLRRIPPSIVSTFEGRIVNIHPALLPAFGGQGMYGRRVHERVLESGARISGATVHLVDAEYDTGPIIAQWPVLIDADDTPETLSARIQEVEHRLLPAVLEHLVAGVPAEGLEWADAGRHLRATVDPGCSLAGSADDQPD